jgi:hypothetical protein
MSWRDWLRKATGRGAAGSGDEVPPATTREQWTVPGIFFDTEGWRLESADEGEMRWSAPDSALTLTVTDQPAAADAVTLTELRARHRADARARGEDIVEVERFSIGSGHGLALVIKQRHGLAANYRATVHVHAGPRRFVIAGDFNEGSHTGTRDALVSSIVAMTCGVELNDPGPDGSRTIRGYFQDAYDAAFDNGALNSYTDDRRIDEVLPGHPLSRARRWLARLEQTISPAGNASLLPLIVDEDPPAHRGPRLLLQSQTMWHLYETIKRPDLLKAALTDEIASLGDEPSERAALCWLYRGCLDNQAGHHLGALASLQKADAMYRAVGAHEARPMVEVQTHLGMALRHVGREREALPCLREAIRLLKSHPSEQLEMLAKSQAAAILEARRDPSEREELRQYAERSAALLKKFQSNA